jgi:hypothetical protein
MNVFICRNNPHVSENGYLNSDKGRNLYSLHGETSIMHAWSHRRLLNNETYIQVRGWNQYLYVKRDVIKKWEGGTAPRILSARHPMEARSQRYASTALLPGKQPLAHVGYMAGRAPKSFRVQWCKTKTLTPLPHSNYYRVSALAASDFVYRARYVF